MELLKTVMLPVPPKQEQGAIAEKISAELSDIRALIEKSQREIDLIQEYRTRLIADVVTGKVDVRHLAPPPGSEETVDELEPLDDAAGELDEEALAGEGEP